VRFAGMSVHPSRRPSPGHLNSHSMSIISPIKKRNNQATVTITGAITFLRAYTLRIERQV
jgi:hypothetical protein